KSKPHWTKSYVASTKAAIIETMDLDAYTEELEVKKILIEQEKERFKVESETEIKELEEVVDNSKLDYLLMAWEKEIEIRKMKDTIQDRNKYRAMMANMVDHYC
ncbi:11323_t:CDS:1, partial [Gigaspora margarita]